ncbi:MAG: hypothetical protein A2946_00970 [Candidatus Liptonbacteria bacterium RIFCSPLOWO2_01_FULL_53_13]|uniref:ribose-phosphate diphosphokinase n=1 Tax=Candidatus Liptonbacteria bacterium RIFCSPLOWO2_01_FULL_53_13 TaxID=1798651 RepID=A0A1G2CLZ3_9BACT|nr:MAG: hypothetical protein A2946_00970 [Candidatus Liptonbacteria bacterium RIFCSPLOWO2_01_FULL_53_13]
MLLVSNAPAEGKKLSEKLGAEFCGIEEREYPDTERACLAGEFAGRTADIIHFLFNRKRSFDDQLFNLLCLLEAFANKDTTRLVLPYLPYCRSLPAPQGEIDKFAMLFNELNAHVGDIFIVAPHVSVEKIRTYAKRENIFPIDIDAQIIAHIKKFGDNLMLVSPDKGFSETVKRLSEKSGIDYIVLAKKRVSPEKVSTESDDAMTEKILANKDKKFIIIDDIVSTGNTLVKTTGYLQFRGAADTQCVTIHNTCPDSVKCEIIVASSNSLIGAHATAFDITESIYQALKK